MHFIKVVQLPHQVIQLQKWEVDNYIQIVIVSLPTQTNSVLCKKSESVFKPLS